MTMEDDERGKLWKFDLCELTDQGDPRQIHLMLLFMVSVISTTSLTEVEIGWLQTNQSTTSLSGKKWGELANLFFCWELQFEV